MRFPPSRNSSRLWPFSLLVLVACGLLLSSPAASGPLAAFSDHTGETHSGEDHRNEYLEGIILVNADVSSTNFRNSVIRNAILTSADFTDTNLRNADLSGSDFTGALLTDANARNADFTSAVLDGVTFSTGNVRNASFAGASLRGADLSSVSNGDRADFTGATYDASTLLAAGIDTSVMTLVPEPSSALLFALGLAGLSLPRRRAAARS